MIPDPPNSLKSIQDETTLFSPDAASHVLAFEKRYLSACENRRLRQSQGSPLLTAILLALGESLSSWRADDPGVDEWGWYELLDPLNQRTPDDASDVL